MDEYHLAELLLGAEGNGGASSRQMRDAMRYKCSHTRMLVFPFCLWGKNLTR